jgi:hypothetical protein
VHPGVIASDFLERAQFRGDEGEAARERMDQMLSNGMPGVVQKPEEIADAVWTAVEGYVPCCAVAAADAPVKSRQQHTAAGTAHR